MNSPSRWVQITREIPARTVRTIAGTREIPARTVTEWHTRSCVEGKQARDQLRHEYEQQWPNYCRRCDGWGGFAYSYDPSPAGVSLSPGSLQDFEPCEECNATDKWWTARCSRCGIPYHQSLPTKFIRSCIQDLKASWIYWRDKHAHNHYEAMQDVLCLQVEQERPCDACGWKEESDGMPPAWECYCWEQSDWPEHQEPRSFYDEDIPAVYAEYSDLYLDELERMA